MKIKILIGICIVLFLGNIFQFLWSMYGPPLFTDAVPDEETALKLAKVILVSAYDESVLSEEPFVITQSNNGRLWHISGSLPEGYDGGAAEMIIRKRDGKVLKMIHTM